MNSKTNFFAVGAFLLLAQAGQAAWTATNLHPSTATKSYAFNVFGSKQTGYATIGGLSRSTAAKTTGTQQVGYVQTGAIVNAGLWTGSAGSWVDINPAGAASSFGLGTSGTQQVGQANFAGVTKASLWTGTAASWIDLHPIGATGSGAFAVFGGQQVGYANFGGTNQAAMWTGSAVSWVNLAPAGSTASQVSEVFENQQVGWATIGGAEHASLWSGTAASWVDLHGSAPAGFTKTFARGIWRDATKTVICGYGFNGITGRDEALIWTQPGRTVSGHVNSSGGRTLTSISIQFRSHVTSLIVGTPIVVPVDNSGNYTVLAPGLVNYDITVKPESFLRRTIQTNTVFGSVTNADLNLVPGDIVNDNVIDLSDYTKLVTYFNAISTDANWLIADGDGIRPYDADINGDNVVDLSDYTIIAINFNAVGDN
ncbi:MAG: hypothetical protein K8R88_08510 [Armatimonadetes bacterium]|nr:hypothetical protein [Armatimonadota bacterium]